MASIVPHETNYSLLALPLYYVLGIVPHAYAILSAANERVVPGRNKNPRASDLKDALRKKLSPEQYRRWERAEAAHSNALEQYPLFAAAVLAGNMARLPIPDLNLLVFGVTGLRCLYTVLYISTDTVKLSYLRSLVWFIMTGWLLRTTWRAGVALA